MRFMKKSAKRTMKREKSWSRLDNAAKIFPPNSNNRDTKVFRFSSEMDDVICQSLLNKALNKTLEQFPNYLRILRKGLFWYYLEQSAIKPIVREEYKPPCAALYNRNKTSLLFEVTYYKKRINLEVHHVLADGTGALQFLRTLTLHYIALRYRNEHPTMPSIDYDASIMQRTDDSFAKYYKKVETKRIKEPKAYHIRGERLAEDRLGVVEGRFSVKNVLAYTRENGCTITELLTAALIWAIHEGMTREDEKLPVVINVPVNLRKYFPSVSARNFFCVMNIKYYFNTENESFDDVLRSVQTEFKTRITRENLEKKMNLFASLEHKLGIQLVPLILKIPALKLANYISERGVTASLSSIGVVNMPEEIGDHLEAIDVFSATKYLMGCICSYKDAMTVSFASPFVSLDIQRCFFRLLSGLGLEIAVISNLEMDEHEMSEV